MVHLLCYNGSKKEGEDLLKFNFGVPASGKSQEVLNILKNAVKQNKQAVLIVPEQFSFETERAVLREIGDSAFFNINVTTFSKLYAEILRLTGGLAAKVLTDSDKIIFMSKTLSAVSSGLTIWKKYANSITFAQKMLDMIGEFKINAISSEDLKKAIPLADKTSLKNKLADIALIYETFDAFLGEKFIDPVDSLTHLNNKLKNFNYFDGKIVIFDSFKGFTGQQFEIISRIFSGAQDVIFSMTFNPQINKEFDIYTNIRKNISRIENIAKKYNVSKEEPLFLSESFCKSNTLKNMEAVLSGREVPEISCDDSITICKATTIFDEAEFAARNIRKLVRTENYRYSDFVIIARDLETYEEAVCSACERNNIPVFYDKKIPLSAFSLSVAINSAIKALNFSTENILKFHKSGLGTLAFDEISTLENYTYLWNINGDLWLNDWDMDVRGFVSSEENELLFSEELETINLLRKKAIKPILNLKKNFVGNAKNYVTAIYNLIEECNSREKLKNISNEYLDDVLSLDVLRQSFEAYINILDSLILCFGDNNISKTEFCEALETAVSLEKIGVIPQMLDEVTFGSADRIRPSRPKIAFILGANQGVFPKTNTNSGILALSERKKLIELGLQIDDNSIYSDIDENYLVYSNLCCSSEKLFVSYATQTLSGEALEPSSFISLFKDTLNCTLLSEPSNDLPETQNSAFIDYCRNLNAQNNISLTIKKALENKEFADKTKFIDNVLNFKDKKLSEEVSNQLFGKEIYMSATRFDSYNRCHFSYFCRYGLNAKKLQPADFDVLQRGTIVHYVLEKIISTYKKEIANFDTEKLDNLTDFYIEQYLNSVIGFNTIKTAKTKFLISKISRSLKEVVKHIALEFAQSDFEPVSCELKIGGDDGIPFKLPFDNGNIVFSGSIDRVDNYNGYIRIVDYKTGSKTFKLPDILFGLNLQMLIYLYAVTRANGISDDKAAGILYMPSKRDTNEKGLTMNGLLKADNDLIRAMEKDMEGKFVPKLKFNKDGSLKKGQSTFILENDFATIFEHIEKIITKTGNSIYSGDISVNPVDGRESPACKYCDFKAVCGIENNEIFKVPEMSNDEVFQKIKEGE